MIPVGLLLVSALPAVASGLPAGVGEPGKPAGIACQQFGMSVLESQGLLPSVASLSSPSTASRRWKLSSQ